MFLTDVLRRNMLSAVHRGPLLICNRQGHARVTKGEGERKRATRRRKPYFFSFFSAFHHEFSTESCTPLMESLLIICKAVLLSALRSGSDWWAVVNRRRSFTTFPSTSHLTGLVIDPWKQKQGTPGGGTGLAELDALTFEDGWILPRYFIFIAEYSVRTVDRGNFCSQLAIQKWRGCGLWMKEAREIDMHGASW